MRGEQKNSNQVNVITLGSPPLARGTVARRKVKLLFGGITPACAGNSDKRRIIARNAEDHPRLRGEQTHRPYFALLRRGSPPLARGTGRAKGVLGAHIGITPACAGNRVQGIQHRTSRRDHPRLRGEQFVCSALYLLYLGSPPLARGTA